MPYICPPQPPRSTTTISSAKMGRPLFDSDDMIEEAISPGQGDNVAYGAVANDEGHWDEESEDSEDDFMMNARQPRMSFDGRPYPPIPPDASTLPRPTDDWFSQPEIAQPPLELPQQLMPTFRQYTEHKHANQFNEPFLRQPSYPPQYPLVRNQLACPQNQLNPKWTPPYAHLVAEPIGYRAPVIQPRNVSSLDRPVKPNDTLRYPSAYIEQIYVAPASEPIKESINSAIAAWYIDQVIDLLVTPGQFRPGAGGASNEIWGLGGRERDAWLRVGRTPPDYSKSWGRMGMTSTPLMVPRKVRPRQPEFETRDPWNVLWTNNPKRSATLVSSVFDAIQRMTISPTAVVAAVWFLEGLGFHDGDGQHGAELRAYLREQRSADLEALEKRVAILGLLLAGKWLDDNSFLSKSWSEVTHIPVKDIGRMERAALRDYHFSLHLPVPSWVDHVNKLYTSLISKHTLDGVDAIAIPILNEMVTQAREAELRVPQYLAASTNYERRVSLEELPAAADQALSRDWGSFAKTYSIDGTDFRAAERRPSRDVDEEMAAAEKSVNALVGDDMDDDEDFLDYDGAKRWLPSISESRRSGSHLSLNGLEANRNVAHWRSAVEPEVHYSAAGLASGTSRSSWKTHFPTDIAPLPAHSNSFASAAYPKLTATSTQCGCSGSSHHASKPRMVEHRAPSVLPPTYRDTGVYLEPGISIIRPMNPGNLGIPPPAKGWATTRFAL